MGKGVIVSHLGDAHYQIVLDIDVSYARNQLTEINLYLDAFAEKYTAATDAKNTAQAALEPINTRIDDYLKAAQADSQAAYDAMEAAYQTWVDAVANQPDPGAVDFLRDAMDEAKAAFDQAHTDYIAALDGDPEVEVSPEDALVARTDALAILAQTMGEWAGGVGDLIDPVAVNDALDAVGVALDDFEAATVDYAADVGNPTLKSAMEYYRTVYDTAHDDWVGIVTENSGDALVQATRDAYDSAVETFDNARQALGALLNNGGMPEELAAIMAEQEAAWAAYHAALQDWQSLTLIKADKESKKAELMSRLLPYTNNDGEPVRQTVNAWCCDFTEDLAAGAEVATIEIPGERDLGVKIRPGYESRETYSASRDGLLQPSWASSPEATYWNWALHPGNARWNPNYRVGEILFIDEEANTCTVQLDPQRNNEKSIARDGTTLDVNNPVKYQIDPDTGEQTQTLPGDNIQVADGVTTLTDVPIEYMECNAGAFEVGDKVVVELQNRDWNQPKVIGFPDNPKPCLIHGLILTANVVTPSVTSNEGLFLKDTPYGTQGVFKHPTGTGGTLQGGNIDWASGDGKYVVTWKGPMGRAIAPRWLTWAAGSTSPPDIDTGSYYSHVNLHLNVATPEYANNRILTAARWGADLYLNGRLLGSAPDDTPYVIGGSIVTFDGTDEHGAAVTKTYVVAVFAGKYAPYTSHPTGAYVTVTPSMITHTFCWTELPSGTGTIAKTAWQVAGTQDFGADSEVLPPATPYHFSASGLKFACCVPRGASGISGTHSGNYVMPLGEDVILRGEISPGADGVTVTSALTWQDHGIGTWTSDYLGTGPTDTETAGSFHSELIVTRSEISSGIVAVDFVGETEATLSATRMRTLNTSLVKDGYQRGYPDFTGDMSGSTTDIYLDSETVTITDDYRAKTVGTYTLTDSRSVISSYVEMTGSGSLSTNISADFVQPIYYDLRYGAVIQESSSVTLSRSSLDDKFPAPAGGVQINTAFNGSDTWALQLLDLHANNHVNETASLSKSIDSTSTTWSLVISVDPGSSSSAGSYDTIGACQMSRSPWWAAPDIYTAGDSNFTKISVPVWDILHYNQSGDVIGNIKPTYQIRPSCNNLFVDDWGYFDALNIPAVTIHAVFASGFFIDTAWQAHLDASHVQPEGEDPITMTALEADIKPEFRR